MHTLKLGVIALALTGALGLAHAGLVVNLADTGTGITRSYGAGTLDTTGLSLAGNHSGCNQLWTSIIGLIGGGVSNLCSRFSGAITVTQSPGWSEGGGNSSY